MPDRDQQSLQQRQVLKVGQFGRGIQIIRTGVTQPSIVFESGGNGTADDWVAVQELLPSDIGTLSYSRAGHGQSDSPEPDDIIGTIGDTVYARPSSTTADLITVLGSSELQPPYVLVAHSLGGVYAILFASQRPELIAGIILVDSRPPDWANTLLELISASTESGELKERASNRVKVVQPFYAAASAIVTPLTCPVTIISADPSIVAADLVRRGFPGTMQKTLEIELINAQSELASVSTDIEFVSVSGVGHNLQVETPEIVVDSIVAMLNPIRQ